MSRGERIAAKFVTPFPLTDIASRMLPLTRPLTQLPKLGVSVTFALLSSLFAACPVHAEDWTNLRGTHTVQAQMVGMWDSSVVLKLPTGKLVTVKLADLRSDSRIQAQELYPKIEEARLARVKEMQGLSAAAASPAPTPLPQPSPAPAYVAPQKDLPANEFLTQLDRAIENGHLIAIYDSLPPAYRQDVDDILKLAASKINPQSWQIMIGSLQEVADLIVTRQTWFLRSPRFQALPPESLEKLENQGLTLVGLLRELLKPETLQLESLVTGDVRTWLAQQDAVVAPYLAQLFRFSSANRSFTVVSENAGIVNVEISGVEPSKVNFVNIEGFWVEESLARDWSKNVESMKLQINAVPNGSYLETYALLFGGFSVAMAPMKAASNEGQFHVAMESLFAPLATAYNALAINLGTAHQLANRAGVGVGVGVGAGNGASPDGGYEDYNQQYDDMQGEYENTMDEGSPEMVVEEPM